MGVQGELGRSGRAEVSLPSLQLQHRWAVKVTLPDYKVATLGPEDAGGLISTH
jgi:hypothetical protein